MIITDQVAREKEALNFAVKEVNKHLPQVKKIGQLIELCFELLPEAERFSISQEINNKKLSDFYIQSYCGFLKNRFYHEKLIELYEEYYMSIHKVPPTISDSEYKKIRFYEKKFFPKISCISSYCDLIGISDTDKAMSKLIKQKHYTAALIGAIDYLIFRNSGSSISSVFFEL